MGLTLGLCTIYMGKPEIQDGKTSGSCHSNWKASENTRCDLRRCNFPILFSLFSHLDIVCSWLFSHSVKFSSFILKHKISTRVVCINGKHPRCPFYRGVFLIEVFVKRQSSVYIQDLLQ